MTLIDLNKKVNINNLNKSIIIKNNDEIFDVINIDNKTENVIINVKQNKHQWEEIKFSEFDIRHKCSRCNNMAILNDDAGIKSEYLTDYCPYCGAYMNDGEVE